MSRITLLKNDEIPLDIPKFLCDENAVGEHLMEHPLTSLLNCYGFLCCIGRPQSGKTSLAISLITQKNPKIYKKTHHHILVMMPLNSIHSLKKNPFEVLPQENIYGELNDITIQDVYNRINDFSQNNEKTLLFIDDMTSSLKASKYIQDTLKKLVYNRRHLKLNLIITAQSYVNIPLDLRKNISSMVLFKPPKKEMELIFQELIETKKDSFEHVMRYAYDKKHNFIFINISTQRLFKNWDEMILNEEDDE